MKVSFDTISYNKNLYKYNNNNCKQKNGYVDLRDMRYSGDVFKAYTQISFIGTVSHKQRIPEGYIGVKTKEELQEALNNNNNVILMSDIDLGNKKNNWKPIKTYSGVFDGNNYKILNLNIEKRTPPAFNIFMSDEPVKKYNGLFQKLENAKIKNLYIENANLSGDGYIGIIAGVSNKSAIKNCHVNGNINGSGLIGGFIGQADKSNIIGCSGKAIIKGGEDYRECIGGFAGKIDDSSITDTDFNVQIEACGCGGGISGKAKNVDIKNSSINADIFIYEGYIGAITGHANQVNVQGADIASELTASGEYCYLQNGIFGFSSRDIKAEDVKGFAKVSGISEEKLNKNKEHNRICKLDLNESDFIFDLKENFGGDELKKYKVPIVQDFIKSIWGQSNVHETDVPEGFKGVSNKSELHSALAENKNVFLMSDIDLGDEVNNWLPIEEYSGVFDGNNYSVSNLNINKTNHLGYHQGLFNKLNGAKISNLVLNNAKVHSEGSSGILAGCTDETTIQNCRIDGKINGISQIGGFVGQARQTIFNECLFSGEISKTPDGGVYMGGIAGEALNAAVNNSCFDGKIDGEGYCGGIFGSYNYTSFNQDREKYSLIKNCFINADIKAETAAGMIQAEGSLKEADDIIIRGTITPKEAGAIYGKSHLSNDRTTIYSIPNCRAIINSEKIIVANSEEVFRKRLS